MGRVMALDVGDRRIGVALSDPTGILASPATIIERVTDDGAIDAILKIADEKDVSLMLAGLPMAMDGGIGQQAVKVQDFVERLGAKTSVPVEYRDERLTTVEAVRLRREGGGKKPNRKTRYDAMAAAVILQEYLDEKAGSR